MKIAHAFKRPNNEAHIYSENGLNEDIRDYLEKLFPASVAQCTDVEKIFKGKDERQSANLIWNYLRSYCTYRRDPNENQIIRQPSYFITRGNCTGDCKTFALFARSVYAALYPQLETAFQYAGYKEGATNPSHVYTVVKDRNGKKIIIDGCWNKFDSEKKYTLALAPKYKAMRITSLSGITPENALSTLNDKASGQKRDRIKRLLQCRKDLQKAKIEYEAGVIGADKYRDIINAIKLESATLSDNIGMTKEERTARRKKRNAKAKEGLKKFGWGVAFINLMPIRAAFNAIVAMNVNSLAHNLRYVYNERNGKTKDEWKKIEKVWYSVGGLKKALLKAIELGAKHKPLFMSKKAKQRFEARKKNTKGYAGCYSLEDDGIGNPAIIAAAVAAASGIISAMIPAIMKGLNKAGKAPEAAQVEEQAVEMVQQAQANPQAARAEVEAGAEQQADEMEAMNAAGDYSQLFDVLGQVAQVGIKAAGDAVERKAAKKPKLKKFLDVAGQGAEDYTTGVYLRKSGYTQAAKDFQSGMSKYLPYAAGLLGLLGLGFLLKKK